MVLDIPLNTYRLQYSSEHCFICTGKPKNCITSFIVILALLWWSWTKLTISPRCTCNGTKLRDCQGSNLMKKSLLSSGVVRCDALFPTHHSFGRKMNRRNFRSMWENNVSQRKELGPANSLYILRTWADEKPV